MPSFSDGESGLSVRNKINQAIETVDGLGSNDNLLMSAAEKAKLALVEAGATADMTAGEIKIAYESNSDTNSFTDSEKAKLAALESALFRGTYASLSSLQSSHPTSVAGAYAYVDTGVDNNASIYIWDLDDATWIPGGSTGSTETPATILSKLLSNPDTNVMTNAQLQKLSDIQSGATANSTDADLRDRGSHTGVQPIGSIAGLGSGDNLLMTAAERAIVAGVTDGLNGKAPLSQGVPTPAFANKFLKSTGTDVGDYVWDDPPTQTSPSDLSVRNETGSEIPAGKVVRLAGYNATEQRMLIALADADEAGESDAIGWSSSAIPNNTNGTIKTQGIITGQNTNGLTVNAPVFLSTVAGNWVADPPTATNVQKVGTVGRAAVSDGVIVISIGEVGKPIDALTVTTNPANRSGLIPMMSSNGDLAVSAETLVDQWGTLTFTVPLFDVDVDAVAGVIKDTVVVLGPQYSGWNFVYGLLSAESAGSGTGNTGIQVVKRRADVEVNALSAVLNLGTAYFAETTTAGIIAANVTNAVGDRWKFTVATDQQTKPKGLVLVVQFRKPDAA